MAELEPNWSPERHLDRVLRRGRQLRRRRRAFIVSAPAGALALVGVLALAGSAPLTSRRVQTAQGGAQHAPAASDERGNGADTGVPPADAGPGTDTPAGHGPSTAEHGGPDQSRPAASAHGVPAAPVPVDGARPPNGDPSAGPSDPSGSGGSGGQPSSASPTAPTTTSTCSASALDYSTVTDRSRYAPGQAVTISLVVHNHSKQPCDGPGPCGIGPWASVQNASGTVVWQSHPVAVACTNPPPGPPRLAPGQSVTLQAGTWNQEICSSSGSCGGQAPPGTYRAVAHRASVTATGTRFSIS